MTTSFFENSDRVVTGPLGPLYGDGAAAKSIETFQYPYNLLTPGTPFQHCVVFNINQQDGRGDGTADVGNKDYFKIEGAEKIVDALQQLEDFIGLTNLTFNRKISRISKSIRLYVPAQTMVFNQNNMYSDTSLTQQLGLILGAAQAAGTVASEESLKGLGPNAIEFLLNRYGGGLDKNLILYAATGKALNPQIEVIFQQTSLREFQFDFVLVPRNKTEANEVQKIIKAFRLHASPRIGGEQSGGRFLFPPDEFDISFEFTDRRNYKEVPKISTCVLKNFNVDYSPAGAFSTFRDGIPTQILISMQFQEVKLVLQEDIERGY